MRVESTTSPATPGRPNSSTALAVVLGVLFLTFLDTTIVSVTLSDLESDIGAGVIPLQWVINAYALTFASLMLVGGSLADRFGRKKLMVAGIAVFCAGSLLAAFGDGVGVVIAGRAVMGVGAAACEPGTLSVIRQLYPDRGDRARALGAWSAVSGLALALGPVVGGLLVEWDGWRAVFWFNVALGVALLIMVVRHVPDSRDPDAGRIDLPGFVLATLGIGLAVYASITGEYKGYGTTWIVALFVLAGVCLAAFVLVEGRTASPMLDLRLVGRPVVSVALFSAFAVYFAVFALFFLTALFLDFGLGYSGARLAGVFAPMAVTIVFGGLVAGRWVARVGSRVPSTVGALLGALGLLLSRLVLADGTAVHLVPLSAAMALAGLGFGIAVVPLTSSVLTHVPRQQSGMAASATNTARQLGAVVGVAALGAIANAHLRNGVGQIYQGKYGALIEKFVPRGDLLSQLETGGSGGFDINSYRTGLFAKVLQPFLDEFSNGLQTALLVALVLMLLAGLGSAVTREPTTPVGG